MSYPKTYGVADLLAHPHFSDCLVRTTGNLMAARDAHPIELRYLADLQRWMLTQAALVLHFEHLRDADKPPISPVALLALLQGTGIASRNTTLSFLAEARHYGLLQPIPATDRRRHDHVATEKVVALFGLWFEPQLGALDALDHGTRQSLLHRFPQAMALAQPLMARHILRQRGWTHPARGVAIFAGAVSGSNILHDIVALALMSGFAREEGRGNVRDGRPIDRSGRGRFWIGPITSTGIAARYLISQSHASRLLARARAAGLMGWASRGSRGECWVSDGLVRDYRVWQAIKFRAISVGFAWAIRSLIQQRAGQTGQLSEYGTARGN